MHVFGTRCPQTVITFTQVKFKCDTLLLQRITGREDWVFHLKWNGNNKWWNHKAINWLTGIQVVWGGVKIPNCHNSNYAVMSSIGTRIICKEIRILFLEIVGPLGFIKQKFLWRFDHLFLSSRESEKVYCVRLFWIPSDNNLHLDLQLDRN